MWMRNTRYTMLCNVCEQHAYSVLHYSLYSCLINALSLMLTLPSTTAPREQLQFCQLSHILFGANDGFIQSQSQTVI